MSDLKSLHTSLLEVLISAKNELVFSRDLNDHWLQIMLNGRWASRDVRSKRPITSIDSTHSLLLRFYSH
jgi:hypothetical protein